MEPRSQEGTAVISCGPVITFQRKRVCGRSLTLLLRISTTNGVQGLGVGADLSLPTSVVGQKITLTITASDSTGSSSIAVSTEIPVTWPLPDNTRPPGITGNAVPGGTLTADPGDWHLKYPEQPGPITFGYYWSLNGIGGPFTSGSTFKLPADSAGKTATLYFGVNVPDGAGGLTGFLDPWLIEQPVSAAPPPPPPQLSSTTNVSPGQTVSGTLRWTVQASGLAHSVKFYSDNTFITEAVADANNWAIDLNTKQFPDGVHQFGYDIYNSAGQRVYVGHHIQVTVKNAATSTPPPPPGGGGGSGGSGGGGGSSGGEGGSGGGTPSTPPSAQTPPATLPQPTPTNVKPPISKGGSLKLLVGGYAQTAARRGEQFAVAMFVIRSDNGKQITAGKVTCALAGKRLVWHGWYHKAAGCRWAIAANAKLGRITGSFSVKAKGVTLKRKFTANVKPGRGAV